MRTGKRATYNRTTGSRTARLYSKRTAQQMNRIYQNEQAKRIRSVRNDREEWTDTYNDYYDRPRRSSAARKKKSKNRSTTVIVASLIVVILVLVFVGLSLLRSGDTSVALVQETTLAPVAEAPTTTYAESDPPVIYGVIPIVVYAGHSVAYKEGIYVEDDTDPYPTLEIDNEDVDLSTPGTYIVSYIARDKDGNVTREFNTVTVLEGKNLISDEAIYELADRVLDSIITEDMSDTMKCLKVYEYLHAINYVDEVHSEDWMQNAYWMLTLREGDCFCYYSAARLLLSRLGYEVMEVRNNNNYVHYWCLVSLDGGTDWWHFDATCWSWGEDGILCLVSDDYLSEFTRRHRTGDGRLIHAWDKTKYPATPAYDFWDDNDRSIIYESGLIDPDISWDPEEWENDGWDTYEQELAAAEYNWDSYVPEENGYNWEADNYQEDIYQEPAENYEYWENEYTPQEEYGYQDEYGYQEDYGDYYSEEITDYYTEEYIQEDIEYSADWAGAAYPPVVSDGDE